MLEQQTEVAKPNDLNTLVVVKVAGCMCVVFLARRALSGGQGPVVSTPSQPLNSKTIEVPDWQRCEIASRGWQCEAEYSLVYNFKHR